MGAQDFADILATIDGSNTKLYTPYVPEGPTESLPIAYRPIGLPADPISYLPPAGFETTVAAQGSDPLISSSQSWWDTIKQTSYSAVESVYEGAKSVTKKVYNDGKNLVGTVYDDVTAPVENAVKSIYWYALLGVVVIAGALYLSNKSGALKSVAGR